MGVWPEWGAKATRSAVAAFALVAALAVPAVASADKPAPMHPLQVQTASLSQGGRLLYWRLELTRSFSLDKLADQRRSLCLLLEAPPHGHVTGELCARAAGHHRGPYLFYAPVTKGQPGPHHRIQATITRPHGNELDASFLPTDVGLGYGHLYWQVRNTIDEPSCTRHNPRKPSCTSLYPHRPNGLRLHVPRPVGCVPSGNSLVFSGPSDRHDIALTFDDGPWNDPPTAQFLDVLERYHAVATFFEIGEQIGTYDPSGALERRMLADGDMIGDHTWTHPNMTTLAPSQQRSELQLTINAIQRATGFRTCLWRPPYEAFDSQVDDLARSMGLLTINYDVDTQDWKLPGTATIYRRAVSGAHNGAIILQHFGGGPRYETLDALPHEITTLRSEGYNFVNIAQLLGLRLIYK